VVPAQGRGRVCARARAQPARRVSGAPLRASGPDRTRQRGARAERIVAAFREAEARGEAAIQVDGEMVDYPVASRAQALLDFVRKSR
jgi:hypothetical protein